MNVNDPARTAHGVSSNVKVGTARCAVRAAVQQFRPLFRGRGHRSAMSLPKSGSWRREKRSGSPARQTCVSPKGLQQTSPGQRPGLGNGI